MDELTNRRHNRLRALLRDDYGVSAESFELLALGLDVRAEVFRVTDAQGTRYFVKARRGPLYEPGCLVPRHLYEQGNASAVAPLPTRQQTLWAHMDEWSVIVYPFIAGESGWNPALTDAQWRAAGAALRQIHDTPLAAAGVASLHRETFDPTGYSDWVRAFEAGPLGATDGGASERMLRATWMERRKEIHAALADMETLARMLRKQAGPYVICHGDLHPGNMIRDDADGVFLVDWDDVLLAPRERDFLFIEGAPVEAASRQEASAFFRGYGQTAIDWVALAYYLWERVVTDVIECARAVCLDDTVDADTKAEEAQLLCDIFADGRVIRAARTAKAHRSTE
jgi:spectinomycin phosphotransferase